MEKQLSRFDSEKSYRSYDPDRDIEKQGLATIEVVESYNSTPVDRFSEKSISTESLVPTRSAPSPPFGVPPRSDARPHSPSRTINRRPDIGKLVRREIESADRRLRADGKPNGRVLIVSCGPGRMVQDVRGSVASWLAIGEGVGVELLIEGFGW